jgi:cysteinyl-tRNA synthetase
MEWNDEIMIAAENGFKNLYSKISNLSNKIGKVNLDWNSKFISAINDDLNMPQAMAILNEMLKSEITPSDKLATALEFDKVLGLNLKEAIQKKVEIPAEVKKLVDEREKARNEKNWARSDELRDKIKELGFEVKDTKDKQEIIKIS